jgi:hypothetical protein
MNKFFINMKKSILTLFVFIFVSVGFAQVKYQPEVTAIFLSPRNESFDPSRFPDIDFYYVKKTKYKNPDGMLNYKAGQALAFDKNGVLISFTNIIGSDMDYWPDQGNFFTAKRGEYTKLYDLTREYIKKNKTMKEGKKFKGKNPNILSTKYISFKLPDFPVYTADNQEKSFAELTKGNPLSLIVFVYLDPDLEGKKALENGENKTGKQYRKDINQTLNFEKELSDLKKIEEVIFGKNMRL